MLALADADLRDELAETVELYVNVVENYTNASSGDAGFDWAKAAELMQDAATTPAATEGANA